ncbi:MAG: GNAT family N-acetyltransferase, partial [Actinomycetota bacterium]|nr:GNAT family N-acetyltransferase [Actinomycetota bacterium]
REQLKKIMAKPEEVALFAIEADLGTFDDNERAIRSYRACGFVEEGRLREHSWVDGRYKDLVHMGIMRSEWAGERGAAST